MLYQGKNNFLVYWGFWFIKLRDVESILYDLILKYPIKKIINCTKLFADIGDTSQLFEKLLGQSTSSKKQKFSLKEAVEQDTKMSDEHFTGLSVS